MAAVASALSDVGANITSSAQHSTDPENGTFFLRMEFHLGGLEQQRPQVEERIAGVAEHFGMEWRLAAASERKRTAIFVSKEDHCLFDLLWRWQRGELEMDLVGVFSNHAEHDAAVTAFGVPYHHIPVTPATKADAEQQTLDLLAGAVDLVVLARYMQILSPRFLAEVAAPIINIHHSFLPAFVGESPYARAHERGVKLIGATAHYVTEQLDDGPIIEQDVSRVGHDSDVADLARVGRDVERVVLARAVRWHLEDRVIAHGNRTVVFS